MTKNKTFNTPTPSIVDVEYGYCNFRQPAPWGDGPNKIGVRIFPGDDTPRIFRYCTLINCELPPGSIAEHCNTALVVTGIVVSSEDVIIDGETITVEDFVSRTYGKYDAATEGYIYFTPRDTPEDI